MKLAVSKTIAAALVAFGALGAAVDAAADGHYGRGYGHVGRHDNDRARCEAHAFTALGGRVDGAHGYGDGRSVDRACHEAINRCEHELDRVRVRSGFGFPFAQCRVTDRYAGHDRRHDDHGYGYRGDDRRHRDVEFRCEAQAERRSGELVDGTRGVETRHSRDSACTAALYECTAKLDRERRRTGRPMPHARCVVTGESRI